MYAEFILNIIYLRSNNFVERLIKLDFMCYSIYAGRKKYEKVY